MKKAGLLIILITLLVFANVCGQSIDSLRGELAKTIDANKRVDILLELAFSSYDIVDSTAFDYSIQALELAKTNNYVKGIKIAYTMVGIGYHSMGRMIEAKNHFLLSDRVNVPNTPDITVQNYLMLGNLYREIGYYDSALFFYNKAKGVSRKNKSIKLGNIYKNIASAYIYQWRNKEALAYLDSAKQILSNATTNSVNIELSKYYGKLHLNLLNLEESKRYYDAMCSEALKSGNNYYLIECKLYEAAVDYRLGDYTGALTKCFEGLELTKHYLYPPQYIDLLILAGEINFEISQYDFSAEYLFKALKISEDTGLLIKTAQIYDDLAWLSMLRGNVTEGETYINKSIAIAKDLKADHMLSDAYTVKSLLYREAKKYEEAVKLEDMSFSIKQGLGFTEGISDTYYNKGLLFEDLKQFDKALELQLKALQLEEKVGNIPYLSLSYYVIARLYVKKNDLMSAKLYLDKAEKLADKSELVSLKRDNAEMKAMYYEAAGDYKRAFQYQKDYQKFNEQINSEKGAIKLAQFAALYGAEKKEQENKLLIQQQESQQSKIKLQQSELFNKNIIIISTLLVLFLLIIGGLIFYQNYLEKSRTNKRLLLMNKEILEQNEFINSNLDQIKQLQLDIEVREQQYRSLVEDAHDTIFEIGADGKFIYSNPVIETVSGYSTEEIMNMHFWQLLHPQYANDIIESYVISIKKQLAYSYMELPIVTKAGLTVWIGQNVRFFYKDGWMWKASVVARDITTQKQAEIDLKNAKEQAERANATKSEFLANVSHELRTPLNGVIGFTDLLSNTPLSDVQKKYLDVASQSAKSLLTLIDDILDFSKLDSGKFQLNKEVVNLKSMCLQAVDMIRYQAAQKGLDIHTLIDHSIPDALFADEMRLKQVLANLLSNAVKFTSKGAVTLALQSLKDLESESIHLRFSVADTGIGINPQNQKRIFEAFVQEDISTTKKFGGTGLGLTISSKILALMESELKLQSEIGKGSEFYFDLLVKVPTEDMVLSA